MTQQDKIVKIDVYIEHQTKKFMWVNSMKGWPSVRIPKSHVEIHPDGEISLPEWLAIDKGLV